MEIGIEKVSHPPQLRTQAGYTIFSDCPQSCEVLPVQPVEATPSDLEALKQVVVMRSGKRFRLSATDRAEVWFSNCGNPSRQLSAKSPLFSIERIPKSVRLQNFATENAIGSRNDSALFYCENAKHFALARRERVRETWPRQAVSTFCGAYLRRPPYLARRAQLWRALYPIPRML